MTHKTRDAHLTNCAKKPSFEVREDPVTGFKDLQDTQQRMHSTQRSRFGNGRGLVSNPNGLGDPPLRIEGFKTTHIKIYL